jgi:hypothetical protein
LSHHQARSVAHRVSEFHRTAMVEHRVKRGRTRHDYELPAIAWRQILDELLRTCFGPAGGKLDRGVPDSAYAAVREIAGSLQRVERHPALREGAVQGWVGDVLAVWSLHDDSRYIWSVYPGPGEFEILWPQHVTINGMRVTMWERRFDPVEARLSWTFEPESHLAFKGRSASPDTELHLDQFDLEDVVGRHVLGRPAAEAGRIPDH